LHASTPPDTKSPGLADAVSGLLLGRHLRGLGRDGLRTALRVLPLPVADFAAEYFEDDGLRAVVATRGIHLSAMGPWSAGTTGVLLADSAGNDGGAAGQAVFARGGPGALAEALASAASRAGVEVRCGADVGRILSDRDGHVTGVALASGDEIRASVVVSGADPQRTLLAMLDPAALGPRLSWRASNLRLPGVVAKVNLGLATLPHFAGLDPGEAARRLRGRIVIAPDVATLERAQAASKYGATSEVPYLEATIPSLVDPGLVDEDRAAPGAQVMSVIAQYAPYRLRDGDWDSGREALGDLVLRTLEGYAPGISALVTARQVLTPLDLEREYGLTGGHPLHGEPSLDQWFAWRPLLGHARYRMPVAGLYLCGAGAHPGGGVTCLPGANAAREILSDWKRRRG
jgi:phytoene dehydrogenase-like protein